MKRLRMGIVGYGYWGPKLARSAESSNRFEVVAICDTRSEMLDAARAHVPHAVITTSVEQLTRLDLDLVAIATPASTHLNVAQQLLGQTPNLLLTKPAVLSDSDAADLERAAHNAKARLWVDLTYLFTPAVREMRAILEKDLLGKVDYFVSHRSNLGLVQSDCSVLWDLVVHDFAIMNYVTGDQIQWVSTSGITHPSSHHTSTVAVTFGTSGGTLGSVFGSWSSALKVRNIAIGGRKGTLEFDDVEARDKLRWVNGEIHGRRAALDSHQRNISYALGTRSTPNLEQQEALVFEFLRIAEGISSEGDLDDTWNISRQGIRALSAAEKSLEAGGLRVEVETSL